MPPAGRGSCGIDIAAYDGWRPYQIWPDPKGEGVTLTGFELLLDWHPDPAKFAKSFEVSSLQADLRQHL